MWDIIKFLYQKNNKIKPVKENNFLLTTLTPRVWFKSKILIGIDYFQCFHDVPIDILIYHYQEREGEISWFLSV